MSPTSPSAVSPLSYETSIQWLTVGRLQFGNPSFTHINVCVRRIA